MLCAIQATLDLYRFMICCDSCDEWYHGKCVHVSERDGRNMEKKKIKYICPLCKSASFISLLFRVISIEILSILNFKFRKFFSD